VSGGIFPMTLPAVTGLCHLFAVVRVMNNSAGFGFHWRCGGRLFHNHPKQLGVHRIKSRMELSWDTAFLLPKTQALKRTAGRAYPEL
jgi:hypothetical protein